MTQRRLARESAVEILYRLELVGDEPETTIQEILVRRNPSEEAETYMRRLITTIENNRAEIDDTLRRHLRRWRLERLTYLDRAILRVGCAEILYFSDVPPKVAINEAVEIAKKFGDDQAGKFVNGVLDSIYKEKCLPANQ
ncbi:MAG: transcription antitermination factor NusB [candidate division WOR-3 bacterium]|uniref:Transcription antitermination protein NusB n=1 Tax=candidate division WOR-3 bacterium TaxID=2052148 RepID=A0A7C1SH49_UNCW3|nr:transcription antitermination factor NusB [candidate division WOR-3 bacterium]